MTRPRLAAPYAVVATAVAAAVTVLPHAHHRTRSLHTTSLLRGAVAGRPPTTPVWPVIEAAFEAPAPPSAPAATPPVPAPAPPAPAPASPPPPSPAQAAGAAVPASVMAEWARVNVCEEGGNWHVVGTNAQGGLGITVGNWVAYGGQRDFGPEWAATPAEQVVVAERIEGGSGYVPDQDGCTGSW